MSVAAVVLIRPDQTVNSPVHPGHPAGADGPGHVDPCLAVALGVSHTAQNNPRMLFSQPGGLRAWLGLPTLCWLQRVFLSRNAVRSPLAETGGAGTPPAGRSKKRLLVWRRMNHTDRCVCRLSLLCASSLVLYSTTSYKGCGDKMG